MMETLSQGVEALISQLHTQGVQAGKAEAQKLIEEAKLGAQEIISAAKREAELLLSQAMTKIQNEQKATYDALRIAARDMQLEIRQNLINRFKSEVSRLVHQEMAEKDLLRQFILMIAAKSAEEIQQYRAEHITLELPTDAFELEKLRQNPSQLEKDSLKPLIYQITKEMIKEGFSFVVSEEEKPLVGIKARLNNEKIEIDLSEQAISTLLLKHMEPRFYALLEGLL